MGGLVGGPLGKLGAVLRVLEKVLRLFHGSPPVEEEVGVGRPDSIGTQIKLRTGR